VGKCFYLNPLWGLVAPDQANRWNINSLGLQQCVVLAGQGAAKFIQKEHTSIYPIAIYLEEQNFLKWKIMVALRLLTGIH
jgi:hypothetical protein